MLALIFERVDQIGIITINDAPMNRMSLAFIDELEALLPKIEADDQLRAIVIRGAGRQNFSVGMNLKQIADGAHEKGGIDALFDQRLRVLSKIERLNKPVIAVMCGYCLGGGLELPLSCHFRLAATEGCKIGLPELDLGTVPAWGGSARLTRCVGRNQALDMILRAKKIDGPTALNIGLVHEIWPIDELHDKAMSLARELADKPPLAVQGMLDCIVNAEDLSLDEALLRERVAIHNTMMTKHQMEGMMAFMQKRKPDFSSDPV